MYYTQNVRRYGQFHVAPASRTTKQKIRKFTRCVKLHSFRIAYDWSAVGLLGSREWRYRVAIVKRLGLISRRDARQGFIKIKVKIKHLCGNYKHSLLWQNHTWECNITTTAAPLNISYPARSYINLQLPLGISHPKRYITSISKGTSPQQATWQATSRTPKCTPPQ